MVEISLYFVAVCWGVALLLFACPRTRLWGIIFALLGIVFSAVVIIWLWIELERPPLRTLGETRLWYAFLLSVAGGAGYFFWKLSFLLTYSVAMGLLFIVKNIVHPEYLDKVLMPALQSPWFVPHVVTYLEAYALLGLATLIGMRGLYLHYFKAASIENLLGKADTIIYVGYGFLSLGLLIGAVWAKEAWGHYWTWDPKETWALLTWIAYLVYIHLRVEHRKATLMSMWLLVANFAILMICWFGVNYLPNNTQSVHTYSN